MEAEAVSSYAVILPRLIRGGLLQSQARADPEQPRLLGFVDIDGFVWPGRLQWITDNPTQESKDQIVLMPLPDDSVRTLSPHSRELMQAPEKVLKRLMADDRAVTLGDFLEDLKGRQEADRAKRKPKPKKKAKRPKAAPYIPQVDEELVSRYVGRSREASREKAYEVHRLRQANPRARKTQLAKQAGVSYTFLCDVLRGRTHRAIWEEYHQGNPQR